MRLGISSHSYGWAVGVPGYPPDEPMGPFSLLEQARLHGVHVLQVADNMAPHAMSARDFAEFVDRSRELGIEIELGTVGISLDALLPYVRLCEGAGCRLLRTLIDRPGQRPAEDEIVRAASELVPHLGRAGVVLGIENHDRLRAERMARIMERVGSPRVGICLDTANSFGAAQGPVAVVEALGPWTVNLHLKDFSVRRLDHRMGFRIEGRPLGSGQLDVPWLLDRLSAYGRDPNAIVEQWTPFAGDLATTIGREEDWVRQSVAYARRHIPG